jgi:hypothetical protein
LDVSVKETSICIVDDTGGIVKEVKVASEPQALLKALGKPKNKRIKPLLVLVPQGVDLCSVERH